LPNTCGFTANTDELGERDRKGKDGADLYSQKQQQLGLRGLPKFHFSKANAEAREQIPMEKQLKQLKQLNM
jgi:hypothetical protein